MNRGAIPARAKRGFRWTPPCARVHYRAFLPARVAGRSFNQSSKSEFQIPRIFLEAGMKFGWLIALAALLAAGTAIAQDTATEKGKLSYAIGFQIGSGLA